MAKPFSQGRKSKRVYGYLKIFLIHVYWRRCMATAVLSLPSLKYRQINSQSTFRGKLTSNGHHQEDIFNSQLPHLCWTNSLLCRWHCKVLHTIAFTIYLIQSYRATSAWLSALYSYSRQISEKDYFGYSKVAYTLQLCHMLLWSYTND